MKMLGSYNKQCIDVGMLPFNGSFLKSMIASLLCGVITTVLFLICIVSIFKDFLRECLKWNKEKKKK